MRTLSRINVSPVKGMALHHPEEVELGPAGISENRRFYLVDESGRALQRSHPRPPRADPTRPRRRGPGALLLTFPDGVEVSGETDALGAAVVTDFYGRPVPAHEVLGPFSVGDLRVRREARAAPALRPRRRRRRREPAHARLRGLGAGPGVEGKADGVPRLAALPHQPGARRLRTVRRGLLGRQTGPHRRRDRADRRSDPALRPHDDEPRDRAQGLGHAHPDREVPAADRGRVVGCRSACMPRWRRRGGCASAIP